MASGTTRAFGVCLGAYGVGDTLRTVTVDLSPLQVRDLLADGKIELIDVRQAHEYEAGRIAGSRLIELNQLSDAAASLDRARPLVFYCRVGSRSAMATEAFARAGFEAHNLVGGLLAWQDAGLPLEPEAGYVADP